MGCPSHWERSHQSCYKTIHWLSRTDLRTDGRTWRAIVHLILDLYTCKYEKMTKTAKIYLRGQKFFHFWSLPEGFCETRSAPRLRHGTRSGGGENSCVLRCYNFQIFEFAKSNEAPKEKESQAHTNISCGLGLEQFLHCFQK